MSYRYQDAAAPAESGSGMGGRSEAVASASAVLTWASTTSPLLANAVDDSTIVLVPWGAIEAHGPHLPISTDCHVAEGLAGLIATKLGNAIVAPTIPFGYAPRTNYPGTISVQPGTLLPLLVDLLGGYSAAGAGSVALIPAHAENFQLLTLYAPLLAEKSVSRFLPFVDLAAFMLERQTVLEAFGVTVEEGGWHAGASETSTMLALRPDLVHMDRAVKGFMEAEYSHRVADTLAHGYRSLDANGVMGDATLARPEIGEAILERLAERFLLGIRERSDS